MWRHRGAVATSRSHTWMNSIMFTSVSVVTSEHLACIHSLLCFHIFLVLFRFVSSTKLHHQTTFLFFQRFILPLKFNRHPQFSQICALVRITSSWLYPQSHTRPKEISWTLIWLGTKTALSTSPHPCSNNRWIYWHLTSALLTDVTCVPMAVLSFSEEVTKMTKQSIGNLLNTS